MNNDSNRTVTKDHFGHYAITKLTSMFKNKISKDPSYIKRSKEQALWFDGIIAVWENPSISAIKCQIKISHMVIISSKHSLLLGSLLTFKITYMLSSKVNNRKLFTVAVINICTNM